MVHLKITQSKRKIIFQTSIFGFHVNFQWCEHWWMSFKCLITLFAILAAWELKPVRYRKPKKNENLSIPSQFIIVDYNGYLNMDSYNPLIRISPTLKPTPSHRHRRIPGSWWSSSLEISGCGTFLLQLNFLQENPHPIRFERSWNRTNEKLIRMHFQTIQISASVRCLSLPGYAGMHISCSVVPWKITLQGN